MKSDINLINKEVQKSINLQKAREQVKKSVFGLLAVFIFVSLLTLSAFLFVNQSYKGNEAKIASLKNQIQSLQKNESYAVVIADRIKGVEEILEERKTYLLAIDQVEKITVPGLKIEGLDLGAKGELKVMGVCDSRNSLSQFNNQVEMVSQEKKYSKIIYPSVNRTKDGQYSFVLEMKP